MESSSTLTPKARKLYHLNQAGWKLLDNFSLSSKRAPRADEKRELAEELRKLGNEHATEKTVGNWFANHRGRRTSQPNSVLKTPRLSIVHMKQVDALLAAQPSPSPEVIASWTAFGLNHEALVAYVQERAAAKQVLTPVASVSPEIRSSRVLTPTSASTPPPSLDPLHHGESPGLFFEPYAGDEGQNEPPTREGPKVEGDLGILDVIAEAADELTSSRRKGTSRDILPLLKDLEDLQKWINQRVSRRKTTDDT